MQKINDWENVKASSDFVNLPAGGYVFVIRKATEKVNFNGKPYLEIMCDVAEGEFKDYANGNEKSLRKMEAYFEGKASGLFKRFIETVTNSNRNFKWAWDENTLVGKVFGAVLYEEEYWNKTYNKISIATKIEYTSTVSVDDIRKGKFKAVPKKTLDPSKIPVEYREAQKNAPVNDSVISDEDCPF